MKRIYKKNKMCSTSIDYSIKYCISNKYTLMFKMFKDFKNILVNLFLKKRSEYNKHRLCIYILKQLPKYYPTIDILEESEHVDLDVDIFIPAVNLAFNFDNVYDKDNSKIRKKIEKNIDYCKSHGVFLYVFDFNHGKSLTKKMMNEYLSEVILKISIHKYILSAKDKFTQDVANANKSRHFNPPSSIFE